MTDPLVSAEEANRMAAAVYQHYIFDNKQVLNGIERANIFNPGLPPIESRKLLDKDYRIKTVTAPYPPDEQKYITVER